MEKQLSSSQYGIAYSDGTEHITQEVLERVLAISGVDGVDNVLARDALHGGGNLVGKDVAGC